MPLEKLDFKEHHWQIVYIEDQTDKDTYKFTQNIWLLNDNRVIDSLRNEYKCDINKQSDGDKEYITYIFKDNQNYEWSCYNNTKYFSLGKLKPKLIPVSTQYYNFTNLYSTKKFVDSLSRQDVVYTVSAADTSDNKINEFGVNINFGINRKSKLFENRDTGYNEWVISAKNELEKLYPELTITNISCFGVDNSWNQNSPGYGGYLSFQNETISYNSRDLKSTFTSDKPFIFDVSRLNSTNLFSDYEIRSRYTVTTYIKK